MAGLRGHAAEAAATHLANGGVLIDDGVGDDTVVTDANGDAAAGQQPGPLGVALVEVSPDDHGVLCGQSSTAQKHHPGHVLVFVRTNTKK